MPRPLKPFGPDGLLAPPVGLGTSAMDLDPRRSLSALRRGMEGGLLHVDTAEYYGDGRAESLVAEAMEGGRREGVFLVSKVLPGNAGRDGLARSCERSLRRLRTDRLDCYLLHHPSPHPDREIVDGFEDLVRRDLIRSYGVSNFSVPQLQAFAAAGGRIACVQSRYSLVDRRAEDSVIPWCEDRGVAFVGHTPLGRSSSAHLRGCMLSWLGPVSLRHGVTPRQVAIAYLIRRGFAIPKSSRPERVAENLAAADVALSQEDVTEIERLFPADAGRLRRRVHGGGGDDGEDSLDG